MKMPHLVIQNLPEVDETVHNWIFEYILNRSFVDFEAQRPIQAIDFIDGLLAWGAKLVEDRPDAIHLKNRINLLVFMCRLQEGENYNNAFGGMEKTETVLENAMPIGEALPLCSSTKTKLLNDLKKQAVFAPCRKGDFARADKVFKALYSDSSNVPLAELNAIKKVVTKKNKEDLKLSQDSYSSFLVNAAQCLWEIIGLYPTSFLLRLASEKDSVDGKVTFSKDIVNTVHTHFKIKGRQPRCVTKNQDLSDKMAWINENSQKYIDLMPKNLEEICSCVQLENVQQPRDMKKAAGDVSHVAVQTSEADDDDLQDEEMPNDEGREVEEENAAKNQEQDESQVSQQKTQDVELETDEEDAELLQAARQKQKPGLVKTRQKSGGKSKGVSHCRHMEEEEEMAVEMESTETDEQEVVEQNQKSELVEKTARRKHVSHRKRDLGEEQEKVAKKPKGPNVERAPQQETQDEELETDDDLQVVEVVVRDQMSKPDETSPHSKSGRESKDSPGTSGQQKTVSKNSPVRNPPKSKSKRSDEDEYRFDTESSSPEKERKLRYAPNAHRQDRYKECSDDEEEEEIESVSSVNATNARVSLATRHKRPVTTVRFRDSLMPPPSPPLSIASSKQRVPWEFPETVKLFRAVKQCGVGNWRKVQQKMNSARTNVQIKDRWRQICKDNALYTNLVNYCQGK